MRLLIDPRTGDVEDDSSSTHHRSLLSIAGTLLVEVSLPKLVLAFVIMVALPAVLLGLAPLLASAWYTILSREIASGIAGIWPLLLLILVLALGGIGGHTLFRAVERSFWSLNSLAVEPSYALGREVLGHLAEGFAREDASSERRARLRAASALGAGIVLCGAALGIVVLVWPATRWVGSVTDLIAPHRLVVPALANSVVLVGLYLAGASLVWGAADATMSQPRDLTRFDEPSPEARTWRVAHLSDIHVVGSRYEFRLESGRSGPRGNERLTQLFKRLKAIDARQRLDLVLITGDLTDAGRSTEWAEFLVALSERPELVARTLILPGNHDLNIVDRANPARFEIPISPAKRLREMRALSAIAAVQGDRVRVIDRKAGRLGDTLSATLESHRDTIREFADTGALRLSLRLWRLWDDVFPLVMPPDAEDGLGVVLLNSNAEAHFSFTNALGLVSAAQAKGFDIAARQFPRAAWILALHHHIVEYPRPAGALSERIGAALINGSWFVRRLDRLRGRVVAMHGHRHVDWIGECGAVRIISAPSPVMEPADSEAAWFYIHTLAAGQDGRLCLAPPERIEITWSAAADRWAQSIPAGNRA
jgi:predicted MPP superfamily phosphohydrolase